MINTKLKVLVIEDSEIDAELIILELKRGGYEPDWEMIQTSKELINALNRKKWDLIIADYILPEFGGPEALETILKEDLDIPFILVSGKIGEETAVEVMKAGAHDFINKDKLTRLIPAIKRELSEAKVRKRRKEAEKALRESEEKYRNLVERANDGIVIAQNSVIKFVNGKMAEMLGYEIEELLKTKFFKYVSSKSKDVLSGGYGIGFIGKEVPEHYEIKLIRKDGNILDVDVNSGSIDFEGRPSEFVFIRDITERKNAELELKRSKEELQKAYEDLKELDRKKTEFSAIATHEIGTPLSVIKSNIEMLEDGLFGEVSVLQKERLHVIMKNLAHLEKLNRELMDISRIDAGRIKLKKGLFKIVDLIENSTQAMLSLAISKNHQITVDVQKDLPRINCDGDRIKQVLDNLLKNAIKYTQEYGAINLSAREKDDHVLIAVSDNGPGVPKKEQKKIFERFYEIGDYLSHETGGAGLGLAIVKGIVEAHEGKVWIESVVGKGSTFYFTLPKDESYGGCGGGSGNIRYFGYC